MRGKAMKITWFLVGLLCSSALLAAPASPARPTAADVERELTSTYFHWFPEMATYYSVDPAIAGPGSNTRLSPRTQADEVAKRAAFKRVLSRFGGGGRDRSESIRPGVPCRARGKPARQPRACRGRRVRHRVQRLGHVVHALCRQPDGRPTGRGDEAPRQPATGAQRGRGRGLPHAPGGLRQDHRRNDREDRARPSPGRGAAGLCPRQGDRDACTGGRWRPGAAPAGSRSGDQGP